MAAPKGSINEVSAKVSAQNKGVVKKGGIKKNPPASMVIHDAHAPPPPGMKHGPGPRGGSDRY